MIVYLDSALNMTAKGVITLEVLTKSDLVFNDMPRK
jgi:hypothetical protein